MIPKDVKLAKGYDSVEDIADQVIENSADAQGCTTDELEVIPITAIDEAEMPEAIENADSISQDSWDSMRDLIRSEVASNGYNVN